MRHPTDSFKYVRFSSEIESNRTVIVEAVRSLQAHAVICEVSVYSTFWAVCHHNAQCCHCQ